MSAHQLRFSYLSYHAHNHIYSIENARVQLGLVDSLFKMIQTTAFILIIISIIMAKILKIIRDKATQLRFKINAINQGESVSSLQTSIAFNLKQGAASNITLKHHTYPQLNRFFIKFFNSAQTGGRVNGQNIALLVGAQNVGKTTYVEQNLQNFKRLKLQVKSNPPIAHRYKSPQYWQDEYKQKCFDNQHFLMFKFNFAQKKALNYSGLVNYIQEDIINQIRRLNDRLDGNLLDANVVRDVVLSQNSPDYMFVYVKDVIYAIINGQDVLFMDQKGVQALASFNQSINQGKVTADTFFQKYYHFLIDILSKNMNLSATQTALRLFLSAFKRIQYEHRPSAYLYSWYETGIDSTNFLFDILNFICGLGALNKNLFEDHFSSTKQDLFSKGQLIKKTNNWILNGNRADVGMMFLNLDQLYCYDTPQFWTLIDHIISRTAHATGLRTHFPVMIELPSSADLQQIHDMGQFTPSCPIIVQIPGYTLHQMKIGNSNVNDIFTPKIITKLFYRLGRNPSTWNKAIAQLAKGTATIQTIIKGQAPYLKKQAIRLQAKFNSLFTQRQIQQQLYDGTIQLQLAQHLRLMDKVNGLMVLDRPGYYIDFCSKPIFQALLRQNILYLHHYLHYVDVANLPDSLVLKQLKQKIINEKFWAFLKWRFDNRRAFNIYTRQIKYRQIMQKQNYNMGRFFLRRQEAHLAQTYYGAKYNYIFHYNENGIKMSLAD